MGVEEKWAIRWATKRGILPKYSLQMRLVVVLCDLSLVKQFEQVFAGNLLNPLDQKQNECVQHNWGSSFLICLQLSGGGGGEAWGREAVSPTGCLWKFHSRSELFRARDSRVSNPPVEVVAES